MSYLYRKLSRLGFPKKYVREYGLPSWWDDALNDNSVAVLEGAAFIADRFNLDLESLLTKSKSAKFRQKPNVRYKG